jgi:hypothetical protein
MSLADALRASVAVYPENEKCDQCLTRWAKYRVLDTRGREEAVVCDEPLCIDAFVRHFEDKDGNEMNP